MSKPEYIIPQNLTVSCLATGKPTRVRIYGRDEYGNKSTEVIELGKVPKSSSLYVDKIEVLGEKK